jgi:hypothetical protein
VDFRFFRLREAGHRPLAWIDASAGEGRSEKITSNNKRLIQRS